MTQPVTTEPVTTEPVTTEPVWTQRTTQWRTNVSATIQTNTAPDDGRLVIA
jgi:hypothetical protein